MADISVKISTRTSRYQKFYNSNVRTRDKCTSCCNLFTWLGIFMGAVWFFAFFPAEAASGMWRTLFIYGPWVISVMFILIVYAWFGKPTYLPETGATPGGFIYRVDLSVNNLRDICYWFCTVSAVLVAIEAVRYAFNIPIISANGDDGLPEMLSITNKGGLKDGWAFGVSIEAMAQVDNKSCFDHLRHNKIRSLFTDCGNTRDTCGCVFKILDENVMQEWNTTELVLEPYGDLAGSSWRPYRSRGTPSLDFLVFPELMFLHIIPSLVALGVGPVQLNSWFRQRNISVHRVVGWIYTLGVFLGAVGAIGLSGVTWNDHWLMVTGFMALAICWLITLCMAVFRVKISGDIQSHKEWMIRNYALTFAACTLRFFINICKNIFGGYEGYIAQSVVAWIPNIIIAEIYIRKWVRTESQRIQIRKRVESQSSA